MNTFPVAVVVPTAPCDRADLASFHNTSPEEAIEAIGSAFRGEAEPMRKYGVLLDDASLSA